MHHARVAGLLALMAAAGVQDPPAEDPKEQLKKALDASSAAGGFTFTGSIDQESPFGAAAMGMGAPMLAVGPEGKCSGTLGANGVSHIRIEKDRNVYELYRKGAKVVHRQVWKGTQIGSGRFAAEAGAVLDLARVAKYASKAKGIKREEGTTQVGDVDCVAYKVELSPDLVDSEAEAEDAPGGFQFSMFELKRVEAKLYFGKDDRLLRKAEFKFVKGFNSMVRAAMPGAGGDEDDEEDGGGLVKSTFSTAMNFTLGAFSKDASVTVPEDVRPLLVD